MKAILISISPEWVAKILNGEKTIEIRKTAPKCKLPIQVYIYCTKNKLHYSVGALMFNKDDCFKRSVDKTYKYGDSVELMGYYPDYPYDKNNFLNGKVVAKFTLRGVEEMMPFFHWCIEKETCLTRDEVLDYLDSKDKSVGNPKRQDKVYAWHISDLEIFDEPKELSEFYTLKCNQKKEPCNIKDVFGVEECHRICKLCEPLTKAPQSWQYVEELK